METLRSTLAATPLASCIVGSGAVALAAQVALLLGALARRKRQRSLRLVAERGDWDKVEGARVPRPYLELVALGALLMIPAATVTSVARARGMVQASVAIAAPAARAGVFARGSKGQVDAISLGIALTELAGALGVIGGSLAFASRRQIAGLVHGARIAPLDPKGAEAWARIPSPETETVLACAGSFAAMGLLPALHGALIYCTTLSKRLGPLADVATPRQLEQVDAALVEARRALESGISASQLGLALATITCAALIWWRSPARARRQWLGRPERTGSGRGGSRGDAAWGSIACVLISSTLYLVSRPLQAENEMSWPPVEPHGERVASTLGTPNGAGPVPARPAPVLEVTPTTARLDGDQVDPESLHERLAVLRRAAAAPSDEITVVCQDSTPARMLDPFLAAARASGFSRLVFEFVERETIRRPLLGAFSHTRTSAARTQLKDAGEAPEPGSTVLRPEDYGICADLSARIVELRRAGLPVTLALRDRR